jgi:predicted small lipoprotein YifL
MKTRQRCSRVPSIAAASDTMLRFRRALRANTMRKIVVLLVLVAMLPACGLKGPLYLSPPKPAAKPPAAPHPRPRSRSCSRFAVR